jgi:hypothetical protein
VDKVRFSEFQLSQSRFGGRPSCAERSWKRGATKQDTANRAVLEKIARSEKTHEPKRALLSLANGCRQEFYRRQPAAANC